MTAVQIKQMIKEDLDKNDIKSWHGIDISNISNYLIEPYLIEVSDYSGITNKYWLVLDEKPGDNKEGYLVVYDEKDDLFGLATKTTIENKEKGYLVGLY